MSPRFPPGASNDDIREAWRRLAVANYDWRPASNTAGASAGLSTGHFVHCPQLPRRRAYLKPFAPNPGVAAREKIASDLAFDFGLLVPPTVLGVEPTLGTDRETAYCVTLVLYPKQYPWYVVDPVKGIYCFPWLSTVLERARVEEVAADALAFDTWVGQMDHGEEPGRDLDNVILGYRMNGSDISEAELVFLDYQLSLGCGGEWLDGRADQCVVAPIPEYFLRHYDRASLEAGIETIETFPDATIQEIVGRVPSEFLRDEERKLIMQGLLNRRSLVRGALSDYL